MTHIDARFKGQRGQFILDVEFSIPNRGITALFGPSGCGKTMILRCIAGLERMEKGHLTIGKILWQDAHSFIPTHKRPIGYVFQEANLFPHLSVYANLIYGLKRSKTGANNTAFEEIVDLLHLSHLLKRSPEHLSGGERQRITIGRALMSGPRILLMDEPLTGLDDAGKNNIFPYLERLQDHLAVPILYVSHDINEIERLAHRMILLDNGRILAVGPIADLLFDSALPFAQKPQAAIVLDGKVIAYDETYGISTLAVKGGNLTVPGFIGTLGSSQRSRIFASDVGLCCHQAIERTSILNTPLAHIVDVKSYTPHQMTVFLNLGDNGKGAPLLSHITRKSWDTLKLTRGSVVYALIKSVALAAD